MFEWTVAVKQSELIWFVLPWAQAPGFCKALAAVMSFIYFWTINKSINEEANLEEHHEGVFCFIFTAAFSPVHENWVSGVNLALQLCHELQTWIAINPFISININTQIFFPFPERVSSSSFFTFWGSTFMCRAVIAVLESCSSWLLRSIWRVLSTLSPSCILLTVRKKAQNHLYSHIYKYVCKVINNKFTWVLVSEETRMAKK